MKTKKIILIVILLLAAFLRLFNLANFPTGINADEAAIGYNAYSLIETGKDEHGASWPIHFKSFGDYKPGLYFYLVLPLVKFFGLNAWSVRLPSALLGILSVFLIYLLVKELFKNEWWGILSAGMLAISPWHLHFSRGGWEVNVATTFILLFVLFFVKSLKKISFLIPAGLFLILSLYTYHSARVVALFLTLALVLFYWKNIFQKKNIKLVSTIIIVGFLFLIPLIISFVGPAGTARFSGVGLFADSGPLWRVNELRVEHGSVASLSTRLIHNRFVGYGVAFLENYFDHFEGNFLFISGDVIPRSRVPETGQLYLFEIPLFLLGLYFLIRDKLKGKIVLFIWLFMGPVAAALTFQTPHALRSHNMVIPLAIISAYGLYNLFSWLKKQKKIFVIFGSLLIAILISWNVGRYLHQYYVHYPKTYPFAWEEGFDELTSYIEENEDKYEKIYVTDKYDQPYIIFLFYLKYPPSLFQREVQLTPPDKFGFSTVRDFGKFHFEKIDWPTLKDKKGSLVIGTDEEIPKSAKIVETIYFRNNKPAFKIVETEN